MIPQTFIQELLARVDVVEVVGRHVKLKKSGANWMGLCPFHGEKSPSFSVSPTKQFYHCFGCGAHGSAIGFLMEHAGLSYVEAIHDLAQGVGLTVPDEPQQGGGRARGPERGPERGPDLTELLATAARFYKARLKESARAVDYLKGRDIAGETAARFGLGYAPDGWRSLEAAFGDYEAAELVAAGLVIESDPDDAGRKKRYDRFRDRIMFPIRSARGQVIGFGGRVLDRGEPKYLNSPETPVFSKGRELYGLFEAREALRREDCAVVVEGYMDAVMLAQHGVGNAVATLGTATTPQHVAKLLRQVDRIVFAFDGDAAGRKAAWRALEASLPQAQDTKRIDFLFLPPEHDPDSFVREHGEAGWRAAMDGALPLSDFMLRGLTERVDLASAEGRARLQADARPLLQALGAPALRQQLVQRIATTVGISAADLVEYLAADSGDRASGRSAQRGPAVPSTAAASPAGGVRGHTAGGAGGSGSGRPRAWQPRRDATESRRLAVPPTVRAQRPDAQRRAWVLAALHPQLAAEWQQEHEQLGDAAGAQWLPTELVAWLERIATLPPSATYAGLRESLLPTEPQLAESLDRDASGEGSGTALAALTLDEARAEFIGALAQVQLRAIDRALAELVSTPISLEAMREQSQLLNAQQRAVRSRRDAAAAALRNASDV